MKVCSSIKKAWSWFLGIAAAAIVTTMITTVTNVAAGGLQDKYFFPSHQVTTPASAGDTKPNAGCSPAR